MIDSYESVLLMIALKDELLVWISLKHFLKKIQRDFFSYVSEINIITEI